MDHLRLFQRLAAGFSLLGSRAVRGRMQRIFSPRFALSEGVRQWSPQFRFGDEIQRGFLVPRDCAEARRHSLRRRRSCWASFMRSPGGAVLAFSRRGRRRRLSKRFSPPYPQGFRPPGGREGLAHPPTGAVGEESEGVNLCGLIHTTKPYDSTSRKQILYYYIKQKTVQSPAFVALASNKCLMYYLGWAYVVYRTHLIRCSSIVAVRRLCDTLRSGVKGQVSLNIRSITW